MSITGRCAYLDYNASAPVAPECVDAMLAVLYGEFGNPSSKHRAGERAKHRINVAREQVASLLGAMPAEIVFTSSGTESNHQAILSALALNPTRRHVVTSSVEHPSTLQLLRSLEQTQNVRVTYLPVDTHGRLNPQLVSGALTSETALVTLLWANNETGALFPIGQAAQAAKAKGALFHTDAVQAVGKVAVNVGDVPADLISFSGHKLHAPPGIGGLFVRKGLKLPSLLKGHQERGRRGGTENVPGIAALGVACRLAADRLDDDVERVRTLRDRLERGILERIPVAKVNAGRADRVANTSNVRFGEVSGEMIVDRLDRLGIFVSQGAACSAGGTEPSHVLTAMGLDRNCALASLRFSLGRYTTDAEIDRILDVLPTIVNSIAAVAA